MKIEYPYFDKASLKKVNQVLKSGRVNYWTGNECKNFEKEFSSYHRIKFSLSVSNGSVALEMALKALNLNKNDSVIVTPRSFVISASCVINLGLKPIFADVNNDGNMNIDGIKKAYTKEVKAVIIVHLNGLSCDLDPILEFVKKKNIYLIEDCSQSHGATYKGRKVGSFGDISTWSFCQDKIISTGGEGGMISTNNKKLWLKLWSLKDHGKNYKSVFFKKHKTGFRWLHDDFGSNYRMTEIQAAIGRYQLKLLDKYVKKRNSIGMLYLNELKDYYLKYNIFKKPDFLFQIYPKKKKIKKQNQFMHVFYRLNFFLNKKKIKQKELIEKFNKKKINCGTGSCPEIYREKIFKKSKFYPKLRLPNAKLLGETSIAFPINPYKKIKKVKTEIKIIKKVLNSYL